MSSGISRDEWLAALGDTVKPLDQSALTVRELMAMFGLGLHSTRDRIRRLIESGQAVRVWKMVGSARVPAYKLVKGKK